LQQSGAREGARETPWTGTSAQLLWTVAVLALLSLVALFAYAPIFSVDFFWHLKLGEIIAQQRAIPRTDLFSAVHPERGYVQFQWLWELAAYAAYALQGLRGVRLMQVASLVVSFATLLAVVQRLLNHRALSFAFVALALVLFEDRFQARPSATVLGFVAAGLPLCMDAMPGRLWVRSGFAFVLGSVWSNIHGGESLLWPLVLGALLTGKVAEWRFGARLRQDVVDALQLFLAGLFGVLFSPTLIPGLLDWSSVIGPQIQSGNQEWQPSYTMLRNGLTPSFLLIGLGPTAVAVAYAVEQWSRQRATGWRTAPWAEWLLCGGLLILSQHAVRNAFLCLVPLSFMLRRHAPGWRGRRFRLGFGALGIAFLALSLSDHVDGYGGYQQALEIVEHDILPNTFPEELAEFMDEAQIEGGILNDGRWGGYLIWKLWPRCHVFVDSRHNLSADMWPVFMASHSPRERDAALDYAFSRWGIELAAFRGPTFALVRAPSNWQLLYKAGDQELYQHVRGAHAAANLERARSWLVARAGMQLSQSPVSELAVRVGSVRWLSSPYQRQRARQASALRGSGRRGDLLEALEIESAQALDAGDFATAATRLELLANARPSDPRVRYRHLLALLGEGDMERSRVALARLRPFVPALTPHQRGRVEAVERALAPVP
jgi:hypothetical protein